VKHKLSVREYGTKNIWTQEGGNKRKLKKRRHIKMYSFDQIENNEFWGHVTPVGKKRKA
jgi:acid phosphatase class B